MVNRAMPAMSEGAPADAARRPPWWPLPLAGLLCLAALGWQVRYSLSLADEGFLWYGAQRVLAGELPLRDFQAYDPARYFWSAAWMRLLGDNGIVALRAGNVVLAAITVVLATWTVSSAASRPRAGPVLATGAIFTLWMVPPFKVADSFAAILLTFALTRLLQRPALRRYFEAGICWGVAAAIGINHALYGSVAGLLAFLYLRGAPRRGPAIMAGFAGAAIGYAPVLALHAFAPGFAAAFIDGIRMLFEYGTTNAPLPFPSPLGILQVRERGYLMSATETLEALLFLFVPLLWAAAAWRLRRAEFRRRVPPAVLAGLIVSVPYAHYAYSRADSMHLAISILPVLAAVLGWAMEAPRRRRLAIFTAALGYSLLVTAHMHPGYYALRGFMTEPVTVGRDRLLVARQAAGEVRAVQKIARAAGGQFFAGPNLPGAYAMAARKSPTWEIYMIFPASPARQQVEIERLKSANIRHALIVGERADEQSPLARTHPLLFAYLRQCLPQTETLPTEPRLILLTSDGGACRQPPRPAGGID
jgi:hypothetical protein